MCSTIPRRPDLSVAEQRVRYVPPLEYRETFWSDAFDGDWAARNKSNGNSERLEAKHGGKVRYEDVVEGETMRSKDAKEAQRAFAEKRPPVFGKK